MDFKFDLKKLEKIFSNNFESLSYAVLGNEYIKKNDLARAITVLQIGQENSPDDLIGKYLLAKAYLLKNEIKKSKDLLNEILDLFPLHLKARLLIIEILKEEKRDHSDLSHHIGLLQEHFPNHGAPKKNIVLNKKQKNETFSKNNSKQTDKKKEQKSHFSINDNMATFTLVNILTNQKHFNEALEVLGILEKKGKDPKKIKEKRAIINKKIKVRHESGSY